MSLPKKGSRKIYVHNIDYRWLVSKWQRISNWRSDKAFIDPKYLEVAQLYGLGDTADVMFNLVIERYDKPISKLVVNYYAAIFDGFLGFEQFTQIKPALIAHLIKEATSNGWVPDQKGDYKMKIYENSGQKHRPAILVLPGFNEDVEGYENMIRPIKII